MNNSIVITTINKPNNNIKLFSKKSKKKNWSLIIIGDKKTPKSFKLNYGNYFDLKNQKKLKFQFAKLCPENCYARKNIGYLIAAAENCRFIVETDDDNVPKKNFFHKITLSHNVKIIKNKSWVNIYDLFLRNKKLVWPRGLPLDEIGRNKIIISKKKYKKQFYLQQGVCEENPDVDAIYRLINKNINIKFKNLKINLGNSISTFNSQNTIWHKSIIPLMYLPVTCTMRSTDIWRSIIALKIMRVNKMDILFFGTTMYQKRNIHDLINDFNDEIPIYKNNKIIFSILQKIKLKKGHKFFLENMRICYIELIKNKIFEKKELKYLNAWIKDCKKIIDIY